MGEEVSECGEERELKCVHVCVSDWVSYGRCIYLSFLLFPPPLKVVVLEHVTDEPDVPTVSVPLEIEAINLNLAENRRSHHTDRYDEKGLVVRRGQSFSLTLTSKNPLTTGVCVCVCVYTYSRVWL